MQLLLGLTNLLPAFPLDGGRVLRSEFARAGGGLRRTRQAAGLSQMVAVALIVAGFLMNNLLLLIAGVFVLTFAHMEDQGVLLESAVAAVRMRDVMLTEFSTLSASATLEDAVTQVVHTLQDVFPVVRGRNLVGAVSRQGIFEALESSGNGYVQGVMTRSFHTAQTGRRRPARPGSSTTSTPNWPGITQAASAPSPRCRCRTWTSRSANCAGPSMNSAWPG